MLAQKFSQLSPRLPIIVNNSKPFNNHSQTTISMYYFIRHAQSHFNYDADIVLREKMGPHYSKKSQEYLQLKFDPHYVDAGLTEEGKQQCVKARQEMEKIEVDLVIVSPMKRALQTCDIIFKDHPQKPRILVDAGVREIFSSSCDIGSRIRESMLEIPYFDYSSLANPDIWYLESIKDEGIKEMLMDKVKGVEGEELRAKAETVMLEYLKSVFGEKNQFHLSDLEGQRKRLLEYGKEYQRIAVVSHYENIFAITKTEPRNAEILTRSREQI